ncbi:MAG TPA: sulfotransferase, partial [Fimbriimonas sp.]|nr:sulfotransferase [Fimbriimonas sp.]
NIATAYQETARLADYWKSVLPPGFVVEVAYEELTLAPEPTIRQVLDQIGLDWHDRCLSPEKSKRPVSTPSLWQVRQPIYQRSTERWRNFEGLIPEFETLLNP